MILLKAACLWKYAHPWRSLCWHAAVNRPLSNPVRVLRRLENEVISFFFSIRAALLSVRYAFFWRWWRVKKNHTSGIFELHVHVPVHTGSLFRDISGLIRGNKREYLVPHDIFFSEYMHDTVQVVGSAWGHSKSNRATILTYLCFLLLFSKQDCVE